MAAHRRTSASFSTYAAVDLGTGVDDDLFSDTNEKGVFSTERRSGASVALMKMRRMLRSRLMLVSLLTSIFMITIFVFHIRQPGPFATQPEQSLSKTVEASAADTAHHAPPQITQGSHPMQNLITDAYKDFEEIRKRQSKSLAEAVVEYRRRYGLSPPPNFDKWYGFAVGRGSQLIDEYDTILDLLTPFWGVKPATIRARARETLGFDNVMLGVLIRHGNVTKIDGGRDWMQEAVLGMIKDFVEFLPDMDICINAHDEPRVILPHEDLARLVTQAKNVSMRAAVALERPRNSFSSRPQDLTDGTRLDEVLETRFNRMQHQQTWTHSRMSCAPGSPARSLDEEVRDDILSYAIEPLGFISNVTAFSNICSSPSFANTYGFFTGANTFDVVHDLFPIFSQSKISSYQDIIFPSPWYWYNKVPYNEDQDLPWMQKENRLYWRGSTTGGYSRQGGWRRQHRQRFVQKTNAADVTNILEQKGQTGGWVAKNVYRPEYKDIFDVKFSHIGQCDPGDCTAQKEFFDYAPKAAQRDAWKSKHLVDIDGNAFSGRFYAFLKSRSLVYKLAIFREWHSEILKPWVHFIPLSLRGDEWLESVRWLLGDQVGKLQAERMARQSTEWAEKVLRNEDMEVWLFRLLLEYGRVVDDDREKIGFSL